MQEPLFSSVDEVVEQLAGAGYLASTPVATTVFLADRLGKPLLVEGPAGRRQDRTGTGRSRRPPAAS